MIPWACRSAARASAHPRGALPNSSELHNTTHSICPASQPDTGMGCGVRGRRRTCGSVEEPKRRERRCVLVHRRRPHAGVPLPICLRFAQSVRAKYRWSLSTGEGKRDERIRTRHNVHQPSCSAHVRGTRRQTCPRGTCLPACPDGCGRRAARSCRAAQVRPRSTARCRRLDVEAPGVAGTRAVRQGVAIGCDANQASTFNIRGDSGHKGPGGRTGRLEGGELERVVHTRRVGR